MSVRTVLVLFLLQLIAVSCIVSGIYLLCGVAWALIAAGLVLFVVYINLYLRLKPNG